MKRSIRWGIWVPVALPVALLAGVLAWAGEPRTPLSDPAGDVGSGNDSSSVEDRERIDNGFAMAPVPLDMTDKQPRLVGLGSYIVNTMGVCSKCHTYPEFLPGGNPHLGEPEQINAEHYLAGGKPFGPFVSRNLTPDASGLPGGRTLGEFMTEMKLGLDLDCNPGDPPPHCPLLQVMPWPNHQDMTDHELRAIYEYLRAIPHAEPGSVP